MNQTIQTLVRAVLKVGAGYLLAKGLINDANAEILISGVVGVVSVVWGIVAARKAGGAPVVPPTTPVKL